MASNSATVIDFCPLRYFESCDAEIPVRAASLA